MIFVELIHSLEKRRAEVRDSIKDREKTLAAQAARAETRLRQDITTLQRRNSDLEKLAQTQDSILFLQVTSIWDTHTCHPPGGSANRVSMLSQVFIS